MRRLFAASVLALLAALPLAATVVAGAPDAGCPSGGRWFLAPTPEIIAGGPSADLNGNGLSCLLEAPRGSGIFTIIDDVVAER